MPSPPASPAPAPTHTPQDDYFEEAEELDAEEDDDAYLDGGRPAGGKGRAGRGARSSMARPFAVGAGTAVQAAALHIGLHCSTALQRFTTACPPACFCFLPAEMIGDDELDEEAEALR